MAMMKAATYHLLPESYTMDSVSVQIRVGCHTDCCENPAHLVTPIHVECTSHECNGDTQKGLPDDAPLRRIEV